MKLMKIVTMIAALGLAGLATGEEQVRTKIAIAVADDSSEDVRIEFDSEDQGFNLHDMQEGENRSIVDKSGKTILVTRQADGFSFDVDGKTVDVPLFEGAHDKSVWIADGAEHDIDVHVMGDAKFISSDEMGGVMVMSGKPIDEATQQAIKSLLESAGHGSDVNFINHEQHNGGEHHVKVVRKVVETKQ